ncbi:galactose-specific lectin nattectin-like [Xiphias gladius]|uniref:galactose-specific lectin nattectin-like n=1 Tax=Xiphias gladius TaxID=8245 RepID=UPI001A97FEDA|nr:galactose-specific lectin nattectin-like [Xiphias gladius]XP_040004687.1 galactose-specific lectin nattectin-like [Xiphias gladius]XP_040004688.1 galactose-specific lectin nattectin-like [Xiphias gladius]
MASGVPVLLLLCLTSGLLAEACCCEEKIKEPIFPVVAPCCPPGWTRFGNRCFSFHFLPKSWSDAEHTCLTIGGNLASIHTAEEHFFVRSLIYRSTGRYRVSWVGGFDSVKEGDWLWTDGSRFDYKRWSVSKPSKLNVDHCLVMNWNRNYWNNWQCRRFLPFLCSKRI